VCRSNEFLILKCTRCPAVLHIEPKVIEGDKGRNLRIYTHNTSIPSFTKTFFSQSRFRPTNPQSSQHRKSLALFIVIHPPSPPCNFRLMSPQLYVEEACSFTSGQSHTPVQYMSRNPGAYGRSPE